MLSLLFLYTSELIPTVIRCSAFGTLAGIGRLGSVAGSQVLNLNTDERPWIAAVVFGTLALISAGLIFTLPETRGRPLTQTLDEAEIAFTERDIVTKTGLGLIAPDIISDITVKI